MVDWRSGETKSLQTAVYERGEEILWTQWKGARPIFGVVHFANVTGVRATRDEALADPERCGAVRGNAGQRRRKVLWLRA